MNIICVGSSAGGLAALKELFKYMSTNSGQAFIVIQHLQANGPALTREILSRITTMAVVQAQDQLPVLPNHVYTIQPGTQLTISRGRLIVLPRTETSGRHHPFDRFLKSLALDTEEKAIAVVLSGYDGDGAEGFIEIKARDGITYAQDGSAIVGEMPASAIATGDVDYILDAKSIALHISRADYKSDRRNSKKIDKVPSFMAPDSPKKSQNL